MVRETSRTAVLYDVHVSITDIPSTDLGVNVGDEVRLINHKTRSIRIGLKEAGKSIACKKGFNGPVHPISRRQAEAMCEFLFHEDAMPLEWRRRSKA
jgi:hypothetical protein